jgi:DNA segregation ATPase FtsK/SpoIIIE, S-DNA-T family
MSAEYAEQIYQPLSRKAKLARRADSLRAWFFELLGNTARRSSGLLLVLSALALLGALASFDPADPSFDVATGRGVENWFGSSGATIADLLYQAVGAAALVLPFPFAGWGWQLLSGRHVERFTLRASALLAGIVCMAAAIAYLPSPLVLPAGSGGAAGRLAAFLSEKLVAASHVSWFFAIVPILFAALGFVLIFAATGIRWRSVWTRAVWMAELTVGVGMLAGNAGTNVFQRYRESERTHRRAHDDEDDGCADQDEPEEDKEEDLEAAEDDETIEEDSGDRVEAPDLDVAPEPFSPRGPAEPRVRRADMRPKKAAKSKTQLQPAFNLTEGEYQLPPLGLLTEPPPETHTPAFSDDALEENARLLEAVLGDFGVRGRIVAVRPGPVVTLYELEPAAGVKSSRVISLSDDIARSMSAVAARVAVIPGRNVIGIELPNQKRETVYLRELFSTSEFEKNRAPLTLALGKTIGGEPVVADLAKMPHLLIAGTTGSGKSVALNTMILSLLYRMSPEHCRVIMIDPKMLELSVYDGIPHLLSPVVIDPKKAVVALKWAVREMEQRYAKMAKVGVRGVEAFNERVKKAQEKGEVLKRTVQTGFDRETGKPVYEDEILELEPMPFIVVVVDEMADLMMISGKEVEGSVQRLAQMARAAGIHLIAATQRPSVDVITGTIKANFPTRISFQVTSKIDSRTILGEQGAEQLLGQGDMLYMMAGGRIRRVHGPFVSDAEVEEVVRHLKAQGHPEYVEAVTQEPDDEDGDDPFNLGGDGEGSDDLFDKAVAIVARERKVSTSYIQRRLQIGYNRAARLIEQMEEDGMISKPNHQGKREILLPEHHQ